MSIVYAESPIEELNRFRNYVSDPDEIEIPLRPENRRTTDKAFTITFIVVIVVFIPCMIYTLTYSSFKNLRGSDNCGNICGFVNEKYDEWDCTGKNYTAEKYLIVKGGDLHDEKTCVKKCTMPYLECIDNRDDNNFQLEHDLSDIEKGWWVIALSVIISGLLCIGVILLFKYAVEFTVWALIWSGIGVLVVASGLCWIQYLNTKGEKPGVNSAWLTYALTFGITAILMILCLTCLFYKVKLIIKLFEEAAKALFEIPALSRLPIFTFLITVITLITLFILSIYLLAARKLTEIFPHYLKYEMNGAMVFTFCLAIFLIVWLVQVIAGAQYMIISGAVSSWFFTRNKQYLNRPLWTSFMNVLKFHMGTLLIGSLIITIVTIIRMILIALSKDRRTRWLIRCLCDPIVEFLKLFSKNAYIQTAMHGQPFFKSGGRAVRLLVSNVSNVIAVNSIGDFVLFIARVELIAVGIGISYLLTELSGNPQKVWLVFISACLIILLVVAFFDIFEATIDSIFMCFCEDSLLNDGMARPFYMTKGLHQFIENCKVAIPAMRPREQ